MCVQHVEKRELLGLAEIRIAGGAGLPDAGRNPCGGVRICGDIYNRCRLHALNGYLAPDEYWHLEKVR